MKIHRTPPPCFSAPFRSSATALVLATALSAAALTGCGPQSNATPNPAPPAANVVQAPVATAATAPVQQTPPPPVAPQPTAQQPAYQPAPPPMYAQPAPQGQPVPQAPPGYANAPPVYAPPAPVQHAAPRTAPVHQDAPRMASNHVGRVSSIEPIRERPQGTGAGGVLGGVLGAVVGNQFGHGNGRTAMTVLGAAGGAVAGNNVERNIHERVIGYRVSVRLDDGEVRSYQQSNLGDLQVGDRVRVEGQRLHRV